LNIETITIIRPGIICIPMAKPHFLWLRKKEDFLTKQRWRKNCPFITAWLPTSCTEFSKTQQNS